MKYLNTIILLIMLLVVFGCAHNYMGTTEFKTMDECRIAMRLNNKQLQCDHLPETLW
jgi:hypothetical protein